MMILKFPQNTITTTTTLTNASSKIKKDPIKEMSENESSKEDQKIVIGQDDYLEVYQTENNKNNNNNTH